MKLDAETIAGFSKSLLQKYYDGAVESPSCHYEWWDLCTSDADKVAIAAPRRHAKSTAITLAYVLACAVFREHDYILIISDTITQACQFLGEVKKVLADNDNLRKLFGIKDFLDKDTEEDVIVTCDDGYKFRISAKGSEQKLRGLKWDNKRPNLVICDDLENDEIVMNKDRRTKFKRWFRAALIPSMAIKGKIRIVGTILHEDSLLNNLMPKHWDKATINTDLKVSSNKLQRGWVSILYRAHNENFTKLLWPEAYKPSWFAQEKENAINDGMLDVYSQEYLNTPIDESVAYFKRNDFQAQTQDDKKATNNIYIAADLAISKDETADYSVFIVAGVDENKILHIKNVIRERLDGREIVDTIISLQRIYEPELFGIEEMQVSKSIGPFLNEEMIKTGIYPTLLMLKHGGKDKISRARSIQARMRAHAVKFDKSAEWYPILEEELCKFPRGTKDDQVDAMAYIGMMLDNLIEAPTQAEQDEDDYLDELRESGYFQSGRSRTTGY